MGTVGTKNDMRVNGKPKKARSKDVTDIAGNTTIALTPDASARANTASGAKEAVMASRHEDAQESQATLDEDQAAGMG